MNVKSITIVSLSRGLLGEDFIAHEEVLGLKRLKEYGVQVGFAENARRGLAFLDAHPEARARDLLDAFASDTDMILCAIGGDDTYRLLPYLFDYDELKKVLQKKIFLGFSDTTMNHLMLHKLGLPTFYGQAFLPDVCELAQDMLPYTKAYFEELIRTGRIAKITPSPVWYEARTDFSPEALGTMPIAHKNEGFLLLQGSPRFTGTILGGCIDSLYDLFSGERYEDMPKLGKKYGLFPDLEDWKGKILLLESSEETASPEKYRKMVQSLKETGIFEVISGVLVGKPMDEKYMDEYHGILKAVIDNPDLPIVANLNVGHATPRCIVPFGVTARVDAVKQEIVFEYPQVE